MISNTYNIKEFLEAIVHKDYKDILEIANQECLEATQISFTLVENMDYVQQINNFIFFLSQGIRTLDVSKREFALYLPIIESLVKKGQLNRSVMALYFKEEEELYKDSQR